VLRRPATVGPTRSLRRRLPLRPRFPINRRLSSATDLRRLPTCADCRLSPTADSHRLPTFRRCLPTQPPTLIGVRSTASLPVALRLAPPNNPPAQPSGQPATRAADRPSGSAFRPTCDRRRLPILRPCLPMDLQLSPSTHLPARPSSQPPAFAFDQPSGPAIQPNLRLSSVAASAGSAFRPLSGFRLRSIIQPNLPTFLQLAPSIDLPAQPLRQPATCAAGLFSD